MSCYKSYKNPLKNHQEFINKHFIKGFEPGFYTSTGINWVEKLHPLPLFTISYRTLVLYLDGLGEIEFLDQSLLIIKSLYFESHMIPSFI